MTDLSSMTQTEKVRYWTYGYNLWNALLSDRKDVQIFDDHPCLGFWRKGIYERDAKGNNWRIDWLPVAIYMDGNVMTGRAGNEDLTGDNLVAIWSLCVKNPVLEAWWRAVAEEGKPWPDAKGNAVSKADNAPPELPPEKAHAEAIDAAIGAAIKTVTSEAEAAQALGSKNRIAELRLAADKHGKSIYEPLFREYQKVQKAWAPMIARATATEKEINTAILTFREKKRQRIAKEQAEAEQRQRELDEANARAADRAIARGEPEPMPVVEEVVIPAQMAKVEPTYGSRQLKEQFKLILDKVTSWDLLFTHYKNNSDVQALLTKLASADIKAGRTVPGTMTREGLI